MDRNTLLWTIVIFFGATVAFGAIANATDDEGDAVRVGLQGIVGLIFIALLVAYVRRTRR